MVWRSCALWLKWRGRGARKTDKCRRLLPHCNRLKSRQAAADDKLSMESAVWEQLVTSPARGMEAFTTPRCGQTSQPPSRSLVLSPKEAPRVCQSPRPRSRTWFKVRQRETRQTAEVDNKLCEILETWSSKGNYDREERRSMQPCTRTLGSLHRKDITDISRLEISRTLPYLFHPPRDTNEIQIR